MPTNPANDRLEPATLGQTQAKVASLIGEEAAPSSSSSAPAVSAAPVVPEIPELQEVRRIYGEAGVTQVLAEVHQAHLAAEHQKLSAAIPGWSDAETRQQIKNEIRERARAEGYSEEEINGVTDARAVMLAYAALQRDKERARRRATDTAPGDEGETTARPTVPRRRTAPRVAPEELKPMGIHRAKKLIERFVD